MTTTTTTTTSRRFRTASEMPGAAAPSPVAPAPAAPSLDGMLTAFGARKDAWQALNRLRAELESKFYEREREVSVLLTAFIAKENVYMLGAPGTGKTALVEKTVQAIAGARVFLNQFHPLSTPEEFLGPFSIQALQTEDRYVRKTEGMAPDCHVWYADEMYNAGTALNAALSLSNERRIFQAGKVQDCPVFSVIGTSNNLPKNADLDAFHDRFRLRMLVSPVVQRTSKLALLRAKANGDHLRIAATMTLEQLQILQAAVDTVRVSDAVLGALVDVEEELAKEGLKTSTRTLAEQVDILRAHAVLEGRDEVTEDDLTVIEDMVWREPADRSKVSRIVGTKANPLTAEAVRLLDAAQSAWRSFPTGDLDPGTPSFKQAARVNRELGNILREGEALASGQPIARTIKLREALAQVKAWVDLAIAAVSKASGL